MANETRIEHASETWLADSTVFEVNRIPAHSDHKCYAHDPQTNEWSALRQSLDGEWRVEVVQASDIEFNEEPFVRENFDDSAFERIQVPGHLQMAGLMNNKYVNIQYPWDGHENPTEPNIPENNHVALYRKTFTMANRLADTKNAGGTVSIVFHGMATAIYVWVNGMFVGYGEDGFTPNEFDITEMLHDGENVVAVACYEYSSASWLEDQDFWRLHGLFRSVELAAQPHVHIENMQIESDWDPESGSASLDAALTVRNAADAATISATLKNSDGNVVWETANCADPDTSISTGSLNGIHPWSAEDPVLYEFEVTVIDHAGNIAEVAVQKVGFRRFRIEDGIMTINGKRIVFKGADRHEFDPKRGRAITEQDMIDDVVFCKRHNLNAIRTSHYPNQERWYELCDEYGIYLIDETNLETHGSWCLPGDVLTEETAVPGSKAHWEGACVDRVNSMVRRDYNHPSVLIWSLGNESYTGDVFRAMYKRVHDIDPNRPVHYEGVTHNRDYDDVTDIETRMYAHADAIEEYLKNDPQKPYISCEYMHAMGNSCGNMDEYTALERYPKYQGGFIWDFIDQSIYQTAEDGTRYFGYGGDFGERVHDDNFCANGLLLPDRTLQPEMAEVRYQYSQLKFDAFDEDHATVRMKNYFLFNDVAEKYEFRWNITADGDVAAEGVLPADAVRVANVDARTNQPGERVVTLNLPTIAKEAGKECFLNLTVALKAQDGLLNAGHVVAYEQFAMRNDNELTSMLPDAAMTVTQDGNVLSISGEQFRTALNLETAQLTRYEALGADGTFHALIVPGEGPKGSFYRAATDNDRAFGSGLGHMNAAWKEPGTYVVTNRALYADENPVRVTFDGCYPALENMLVSLEYRFYGDGSIRVQMHLSAPEHQQLIYIPVVGMQMTLPKAYERMTYFGCGPEENYTDRHSGTKVGCYETTVTDNFFPYMEPSETGNRTGVRWIALTDETGEGLLAAADSAPMEASALHYTPEALTQAKHPYQLTATENVILRLNAVQIGLGGDNSWYRIIVHEPYLTPLTRDYDYAYILSPLSAKEDAMEKARTIRNYP